MIELDAAFEAIWSKLPDMGPGEPICLSAANLPASPPVLQTGSLCITKSLHFYNQFPVDSVSIEGERQALGSLGLLVFTVALRANHDRVTLHLTHPRSAISRLIIEAAPLATGSEPGLHLVPAFFNYFPETMAKHPWLYSGIPSSDLPSLVLTNERECVVTAAELETRNVAIGFGEARGACLFAELLLNASRPGNSQLEFALESENGFRGVAPASVEMTIWLPGSIGNLDHAMR